MNIETSRRDHFAGLAMQSILNEKLKYEPRMNKEDFEAHIVEQSFDLADSMIGYKENELIKTIEILSGLVYDIGNLLAENDIEWQQAGYYNEAKKLLKKFVK
jgi:hypothetical protein